MLQLLQKTLESRSSTVSLKVDPAESIVHPSVFGCDGEPQPTPPLEIVLNFIQDAYHDRNGSLFVPDHLRMSRDISNSRIASKLKAYRTRNRHFVNGEDCYPILEWIKKTQK
ncbi:tRNA dimethylallyltransferase [Trifolium repens]|nr:tRNA dimethylallyltransferase [Trifolium repens]